MYYESVGGRSTKRAEMFEYRPAKMRETPLDRSCPHQPADGDVRTLVH